MSKNNLWIVCVIYKPDIKLLQDIVFLFRDDRVVIADNSDGNPYFGLKKSKNCVMLPSSQNLGYGAGANRGLSYAFEHGANNVIVINQDASFSLRSVQALHETCRTQDSTISGPVMGWIDPLHYSTDLTFHHQDVSYVSGSCMVISRDVFEATKGFNESYFMYYEDADICMRARMLGFLVEKLSVPGFKHDEKVGSLDAMKEYYLSRNHLRFVMNFAPFHVKMREFFRIPLRLYRYSGEKNRYAIRGIADFLLGKTGKMGDTT
ncbi:glycosyltransferase family 2 protein [Candidatus Gottesmanbacteria bacterium]|nr:glycosyltransferase family 2 protein [Candidatus Gottesmanbacteria bacterium]